MSVKLTVSFRKHKIRIKNIKRSGFGSKLSSRFSFDNNLGWLKVYFVVTVKIHVYNFMLAKLTVDESDFSNK